MSVFFSGAMAGNCQDYQGKYSLSTNEKVNQVGSLSSSRNAFTEFTLLDQEIELTQNDCEFLSITGKDGNFRLKSDGIYRLIRNESSEVNGKVLSTRKVFARLFINENNFVLDLITHLFTPKDTQKSIVRIIGLRRIDSSLELTYLFQDGRILTRIFSKI